MESKDELREIDIKNCTCYYYILQDEKLYKEKYENILICDISYKTLMGGKPLRIRFDKLDGFIKVYDAIRYLVIFDYWWYDEIYNRIR